MVGIAENLVQGADLPRGGCGHLSDTLNRGAVVRLKVDDQKVWCLTPLCSVKVTAAFNLLCYHTTRSNTVFKVKVIKV